jgi:hypothetical protein
MLLTAVACSGALQILHMTVDDLGWQQAEAGQLPRRIIHPASRG